MDHCPVSPRKHVLCRIAPDCAAPSRIEIAALVNRLRLQIGAPQGLCQLQQNEQDDAAAKRQGKVIEVQGAKAEETHCKWPKESHGKHCGNGQEDPDQGLVRAQQGLDE